jgi:hypothetical protein
LSDRLPHGKEAILDIRKIESYCLSPSHPRGRHKARVFRDALDLQPSDAPWLRVVLLEAAQTGEARQVAADAWGTHWRLDVAVRRHEKRAVVRSIWIIRKGENTPRFVTSWVL